MKEVLKIAAAVLLPNVGGFVNGYITQQNIKNWYQYLNFPSFRPPNWLFAPVWISLFSGMGYASYLVWRDGNGFAGNARLPLILYGTQLALNWAWTPIFFGLHDIKAAFIEVVVLTGAASACAVTFYRVNKVAGLLFAPYIGWLCFASVLNYSLMKLNPDNKTIWDDEKQR